MKQPDLFFQDQSNLNEKFIVEYFDKFQDSIIKEKIPRYITYVKYVRDLYLIEKLKQH